VASVPAILGLELRPMLLVALFPFGSGLMFGGDGSRVVRGDSSCDILLSFLGGSFP